MLRIGSRVMRGFLNNVEGSSFVLRQIPCWNVRGVFSLEPAEVKVRLPRRKNVNVLPSKLSDSEMLSFAVSETRKEVVICAKFLLREQQLHLEHGCNFRISGERSVGHRCPCLRDGLRVDRL